MSMFDSLVLRVSTADNKAFITRSYGLTSQEIAQVVKQRSSYVDRPFSERLKPLAAVHVGKTVPSDMMLYPGGSATWKAEKTLSDRTITLRMPQIFSFATRSEEHTSELQSRRDLVCRL